MMASRSSCMSEASSRAIALVLTSTGSAACGTAMALLRLPRRRCLAAAEACSEGELPTSLVGAGIPIAARLEGEPPGSLGDSSALPPGTVISGRACPSGQLALRTADPDGDPRGHGGR